MQLSESVDYHQFVISRTKERILCVLFQCSYEHFIFSWVSHRTNFYENLKIFSYTNEGKSRQMKEDSCGSSTVKEQNVRDKYWNSVMEIRSFITRDEELCHQFLFSYKKWTFELIEDWRFFVDERLMKFLLLKVFFCLILWRKLNAALQFKILFLAWWKTYI